MATGPIMDGFFVKLCPESCNFSLSPRVRVGEDGRDGLVTLVDAEDISDKGADPNSNYLLN
jgi:hypothetical protein